MPLETEAKFRVESHTPVRLRLTGLGAKRLGCVLETNHIFDHADGSLRRRGCGLRIRSTLSQETSEQAATMTFKGPVAAGAFKTREELEVRIDDAATAVRMLEQMGFVRILWYQKRRESWALEPCRVELDEPPHIGLFVEIEGPSEAAVRTMAARLGLEGASHVKPSYLRLLSAYCVEHEVPNRALPLTDATRSPA